MTRYPFVMTTHGGKRPGAGRKPGSRGVRTVAATELVREAQERFPGYNPISALIALAKDAEQSGDVETARQCHASVLPYTAPRFRPVECDPEAALEYEERVAEIRARHNARALKDTLGLTGLADRLERARMAKSGSDLEAAVIAVMSDAADVVPLVIENAAEDAAPSAGPEPAPAAKAEPASDGAGELIAAQPPTYRPFLPAQQDMVQVDYDVTGSWGLD